MELYEIDEETVLYIEHLLNCFAASAYNMEENENRNECKRAQKAISEWLFNTFHNAHISN
jgi:hypothetical protein